MRPSLGLALAAPFVIAACTSRPAEPPPPPLPLAETAAGEAVETFALAFSTSSIEGCSQTDFSSSHQGTLTLRLLPEARAELSYEAVSFEHYASRVDEHSSNDRSRERVVWAGEARAEAGAVQVRLAWKHERCEVLPFYGDGPGVLRRCSAFRESEREAITLRCSPGTVKVHTPADRDAGAAQESVAERPALRCRPASPLPYPFDTLVIEGDLSFPRDPEIRLSRIEDMGFRRARFEPIPPWNR